MMDRAIGGAGKRIARYARARLKRRALRIAVLAPHPDDDVIGCGGLLQRLAIRGARCRIIYVTDGSASHVKSKRFPPAVLRDLREDEACAALRALGIRAQAVFLRAPDGKLAGLPQAEWDALVAAIARLVRKHRTQMLLVPWLRDPHPDHIATARLGEAAIAGSPHRPATFMYGVWLPVRGTVADEPDVHVTEARELTLTSLEVTRKRAAILAHRTQATDLIDDDPDGFRIDEALLSQWLAPIERFYCGTRR